MLTPAQARLTIAEGEYERAEHLLACAVRRLSTAANEVHEDYWRLKVNLRRIEYDRTFHALESARWEVDQEAQQVAA